MKLTHSFTIGTFLCAAIVGCQSPTVETSIKRAVAGNGVRSQLQEIAAVFEQAVGLLNREPEEGESISSFLLSIPAESSDSFRDSLHFDTDGHLILSDGSRVDFETSDFSCMLFDNGSITTLTYTFSAAGHLEKAAIVIQSIFGDPFARITEPNQMLQTRSTGAPV